MSPAVTLLTPVVVHALPGSYCQWTGTFNGDWDDEANWTSVSSGCTGTSVNNAGVPSADPNTVPGTGDNLVFDTSASANDPVNNMIGLSVGSISFSGTGGAPLPVSGSALTLTGNITDESDQTGNSIDNNVAISGTTTVTPGSGNLLTVSGIVSGAGSLILAGSGTLALEDVTLTGAVTVNGGTLEMRANSVADATVSGVTVASGATFAYDAFQFSSVTTYTLSTPINSAGGTLDFTTATGTGTTLNLTGTITLTGDTNILTTTGTVVHVQGPLHGPGFKLATANSGAVLNESTDNTSATPSGDINPAATAPTATPGAPDTGFALVSAHPGVTLAITLAATTAIIFAARKTSSARR
jgi:hypothetical protein